MPGELLSGAAPGTLPYVVSHLKTWLSHHRPGIVWVEYRSAEIRDVAVQQIDNGQSTRIEATQAGTRQDWEELRGQIERASGIIQVLFSDDLAPPDGIRLFAIALNLDRERIFAAPSQQIWWLPRDFAAKLKSFLPDFLSWVHVRFNLDQGSPDAVLFSLDAPMIAHTLRGSLFRKLPTDAEPDDLLSRSLELFIEGNYEEALALAAEAVYYFRQLSYSDPSLRSKLADSLYNLATIQSALKQAADQALVSGAEAVAIRRKIAVPESVESLFALARSQELLSRLQYQADRIMEAVASAQEATDLFRRLVDLDRSKSLEWLAITLSSLAVLRLLNNEPSEALVAAQEAADLFRILVNSFPDVSRSRLATSLSTLGFIHNALGHPAEAAQLTEEAAQLSSSLDPEQSPASPPATSRPANR